MFARLFGQDEPVEATAERGFDSFELRLGDMMRGERATLGKSLLDVQRELRIKAAYIAAIEDCDTSAFETPGFIAGYVRSYARYLGMDPEWTFEAFCAESGFVGVHGMSAAASGEARRPADAPPTRIDPNDVIATARTPFTAPSAGWMPQVEPGALGSFAVLIGLCVGLTYGGWSILQEVQRVQVAPIEAAPELVAEIADPLSGVALDVPQTQQVASIGTTDLAPSTEALNRLYRPQALDVPVLVPRDAPISTIEPGALGALSQPDTVVDVATVAADPIPGSVPQVLEQAPDEVVIFAVRPAWVRVSSADGSELFQKILDAGEGYAVPLTEVAASLHAGNSGSVYFMIGGETYGPAGPGTSVARGVTLGTEDILASYAVADADTDGDLVTSVVAQLTLQGLPNEAE